MTLLIIITVWLLGCGLLAFLNARFWKIMPDLEGNEGRDAKARNTAPVMPQTPIPHTHVLAYYRDWFIALVVIGLFVWGIVKIFN